METRKYTFVKGAAASCSCGEQIEQGEYRCVDDGGTVRCTLCVAFRLSAARRSELTVNDKRFLKSMCIAQEW